MKKEEPVATKNRTKDRGRGKLFLVPKTPVSEGAVFEEGDSPSFSTEKPSAPAPEQALKPTALTGRRASSSPVLQGGKHAPSSPVLQGEERAPSSPVLQGEEHAPSSPVLQGGKHAPSSPVLQGEERAPSSTPRRDLSNNLLRLERKAAFFHFALQEIHDLAG